MEKNRIKVGIIALKLYNVSMVMSGIYLAFTAINCIHNGEAILPTLWACFFVTALIVVAIRVTSVRLEELQYDLEEIEFSNSEL